MSSWSMGNKIALRGADVVKLVGSFMQCCFFRFPEPEQRVVDW